MLCSEDWIRCDEPFPAALLLPAVVVGHNLTAITQGMSDVDLDHAVGATYINQVLQLSPNDLTHINKLTVTKTVTKFLLLQSPKLITLFTKLNTGTYYNQLNRDHNVICFSHIIHQINHLNYLIKLKNYTTFCCMT